MQNIKPLFLLSVATKLFTVKKEAKKMPNP
jgi:hypothetical protein